MTNRGKTDTRQQQPDTLRLLIITYYWPPSGGSGVQRWLKFTKYLPQFGWQPVVYTPSNPDFDTQDLSLSADIPAEAEILKTRIWEPYQIYRLLNRGGASNANFGMTGATSGKGIFSRISLWARGNIFVPDPRVFWRKPSVSFLKKYLLHHPVDAMVTTGPPHSMHLIGLGLKKIFPLLPWIADMRDPWSRFDVHNSFFSESGKQRNSSYERQVLDASDRVIMVSPSLREEFQDIPDSKLVLLHNGFDEHDFQNLPKGERTDPRFSIYHTGLLNYIRNPQVLWDALEELSQENQDFGTNWRLELIGKVDPKITTELAGRPELSKNIRVREWMSHEELLRENQNADLLLVLVNQSRNAKAQLTGKLFEYLALQKPILALCPPDADIAQLLRETGAGDACSWADKLAIKQAILTRFTAFRQNLPFAGNPRQIETYSRRKLTERLSQVLQDLVFSSPPIAGKS
jgi:glycosyltransferase involved in cell wall biosynthesis